MSAAGSVSSEDGPRKLASLNFHRRFRKKEAGDVILQGDDDLKLCFYFRLSRLAALSSFFSDLPLPCPEDMVEGVPLIPLHDTSSPAILLSLLAIRSLTEATPFNAPPTSGGISIDLTSIIQAAVFAKMFDLPVIYRLIIDASRSLPGLDENHVRLYLNFAIWSIAGVQGQITWAAEETFDSDITKVPNRIIAALRNYAPDCLFKLQDLHLRRPMAVSRFRSEPFFWDAEPCNACASGEQEIRDSVEMEFSRAHTIDAILAVEEDDYGLDCEDCIERVAEQMGPRMMWFKGFSSQYGFELTLLDCIANSE